jgi:dTDP-4-amino-4,6-dideoxygalactose transaminase
MIFSKKFHLMYQNLSIKDAIFSIKYYLKNKNKIIRILLSNYEFIGINFLFFDSGRTCLSFILENIKSKNSCLSKNEILTPSFTCEVVPVHILKSNYKPIYYDLCPDTKNLLQIIKKNVTINTKAIIYQHSFGRHDNITKLAKYCKKKKIYLIEDKALCFLSKKKNLKELQGDFAYYSFETSKTISTRMGGMLVFSKNKKYHISYQNNFYYNFVSDLRTILSLITYNIQGYFGFGIRKILIILNFLEKSITSQDLIYQNKHKPIYYDLTNFQKCLLIVQLKNLIIRKKIFEKNIFFWKRLLPDLKIENSNEYLSYYPVRLAYNGIKAKKLKKKIRELGLMQEAWFDGGVGSRNFKSYQIGFNLKKFKLTRKFCNNYLNLPTMVGLRKNFKEKIKLILIS